MNAARYTKWFFMAAVPGMVLTGHPAEHSEEARTGADFEQARPPAAIDATGAFTELVRLIRAGVEESVILAYIEQSLRLFELDADGIIYLTDLGAPAEIIRAVMEHDERLIEKGISPDVVIDESAPLQEAVELVEEQPAEVTKEYFYERLEPYGVWVYIDGYGRCWRPTVAAYHVGWHPYCDNGHWVHTVHGWYWVSGYTWGNTAFHYGRWFRHAHYGWCWWPDTVWAPSWVCWRYDRNYCGWAPLPPYTVYRAGVGVVYRERSVALGFDFGLNAAAFTFVATENFCDPKPWRHRIERGEAERIYSRTATSHHFDYDARDRRIRNSGIPPHDIAAATGKEIRPVPVRHVKGETARSGNSERIDRKENRSTGNRADRVLSPQSPASTYHRTVQHPQSSAGSKSSGQGGGRTSAETKESDLSVHSSGSRPPIRSNHVTPQNKHSESPSQKQIQHSRPQPVPKSKPSKKPQTPAPKAKGQPPSTEEE